MYLLKNSKELKQIFKKLVYDFITFELCENITMVIILTGHLMGFRITMEANL